MAGQAIWEGDTIYPVMTLHDASGVAVTDASEVAMTLYGPPGFAAETRRLSLGEVENRLDGSYAGRFTLGPEGRYIVVSQATSLAGDVKGAQWEVVAQPLRGVV